MSFELGVLYVPPSPLPTAFARSIVPWQTPARPYGKTTVPYSLSFLAEQMSGEGEIFGESAVRDAADARAVALQLASSDTSAGVTSSVGLTVGRLPALLSCVLGELRSLCKLRVESEEGVVVHRRLPSPPPARSSHLWLSGAAGSDCVPSGEYTGGAFVPFPILPCNASVIARAARHFTAGTRAKPNAALDRSLTFYALAGAAGDGSTAGGSGAIASEGGYIANLPTVFAAADKGGPTAADSAADGREDPMALPTLRVQVPTAAEDPEGGGPPGGFLVLLLSPTDASANARLLRDASLARSVVEERCWGVLVLRPRAGFDSSWSDGLATDHEPSPTTHSDLVALQYGVAELPALLLLSPDGKHEVLKLAGEAALRRSGLCAGDGSALSSLLTGPLVVSEIAESRRKLVRRREDHAQVSLVPSFYAEMTAAAVQALGWRLLVINVEGSLKRAARLSMPPTAGTGHDSFQPLLVPLLRALLLRPLPGSSDDAGRSSGGSDGVGCSLGGSSGDGQRQLALNAPRLALLSDLGHLCSENASGALHDESRVRRAIDEQLPIRLANELGLADSSALRDHHVCRTYHSFVPLSCAEPPKADERCQSPARGEWTHEWCRPRPGALLQACDDFGVAPGCALVLCVDHRDTEAAARAGMASIQWQALLGENAIAHVRWPGDEGGAAGGVTAPGAFVPGWSG